MGFWINLIVKVLFPLPGGWSISYLLVKTTNSKTGSTITGRSTSIGCTLIVSLANSIHNSIWCITRSCTFPIRKWNNRKQRKWFLWKTMKKILYSKSSITVTSINTILAIPLTKNSTSLIIVIFLLIKIRL